MGHVGQGKRASRPASGAKRPRVSGEQPHQIAGVAHAMTDSKLTSIDEVAGQTTDSLPCPDDVSPAKLCVQAISTTGIFLICSSPYLGMFCQLSAVNLARSRFRRDGRVLGTNKYFL
jgi:hypothetical protein